MNVWRGVGVQMWNYEIFETLSSYLLAKIYDPADEANMKAKKV